MVSSSRRITRAASVIGLVLSLSAALPASAGTIKLVDYNTDHGGTAKTPATTDAELDTIAAENPDVVVLQEADKSQLGYFVNGLNSRLGTSKWHGVYAQHCQTGTAPTCSSYATETVMILTRLTTLSTDSTLIWAKDDYHVARGTIHMKVAMEDGTPVNVFVCHLPALGDSQNARVAYVTAFQAWAQSFGSPRLVGGDFNDSPGTPPIVAMTQQYNDAWKIGGTGTGLTHAHGTTLATRIDYWFHDATGTETLAAIKLVAVCRTRTTWRSSPPTTSLLPQC